MSIHLELQNGDIPNLSFLLYFLSCSCSVRLTKSFYKLIMCEMLYCKFYPSYCTVISKPAYHRPSANIEESEIHASTTLSSLSLLFVVLCLPHLFLGIPLAQRQDSVLTTFSPGMLAITESLSLFPLATASWPHALLPACVSLLITALN